MMSQKLRWFFTKTWIALWLIFFSYISIASFFNLFPIPYIQEQREKLIFCLSNAIQILSTKINAHLILFEQMLDPTQKQALQALHEENFLLHMQIFQLQKQNQLLKKSVNYVLESEFNFKTSLILAYSISPNQYCIEIYGGQDQGFQKDQIVFSQSGLLGKILKVNSKSSTVLLLQDPHSKIAVTIKCGGFFDPEHLESQTIEGLDQTAQAILTGDGFLDPYLSLFRNSSRLKQGCYVYSSGEGSIFPASLPIGITLEPSNPPRVKLFSTIHPLNPVYILQN